MTRERELGGSGTYEGGREWRALLEEDRWLDVRRQLQARLGVAHMCARPLRQILDLAGATAVTSLAFESLASRREEITTEIAKLSFPDLLAVYSYYRHFGDLRTAHLLRREMLQTAWHLQSRSPSIVPEALAAGLELGRAREVLETLLTKPVPSPAARKAEEIRALALALVGEVPEATRLWMRQYGPREWNYHKLINGKTIALVGPAPPGHDIGGEIDSFELVIRTNYRLGLNEPRRWFGARADVSYYNNEMMRDSACQREVLASVHELRWAIFKTGQREAQFRALALEFGGEARTAYQADIVYCHAMPPKLPNLLYVLPLAIPNILFDLMRFAPGRLKIFCANFFNSGTPYSAGYRATALDTASRSRSIRIHEPFSQFVFVRNLGRAGVCETDALTAGALDRDSEQSADDMHGLYGQFTLA